MHQFRKKLIIKKVTDSPFLAYKIGQLKMLELRAKAERELGDRFDIRTFHDELLGAGAIPLDALENRMNHWISTEKAKL